MARDLEQRNGAKDSTKKGAEVILTFLSLLTAFFALFVFTEAQSLLLLDFTTFQWHPF